MATIVDHDAHIIAIAAANGWNNSLDNHHSWWTRTFTRSGQLIQIRTRRAWKQGKPGSTLTDVVILDGSGVILKPKRDKLGETLKALASA